MANDKQWEKLKKRFKLPSLEDGADINDPKSLLKLDPVLQKAHAHIADEIYSIMKSDGTDEKRYISPAGTFIRNQCVTASEDEQNLMEFNSAKMTENADTNSAKMTENADTNSVNMTENKLNTAEQSAQMTENADTNSAKMTEIIPDISTKMTEMKSAISVNMTENNVSNFNTKNISKSLCSLSVNWDLVDSFLTIQPNVPSKHKLTANGIRLVREIFKIAESAQNRRILVKLYTLESTTRMSQSTINRISKHLKYHAYMFEEFSPITKIGTICMLKDAFFILNTSTVDRLDKIRKDLLSSLITSKDVFKSIDKGMVKAFFVYKLAGFSFPEQLSIQTYESFNTIHNEILKIYPEIKKLQTDTYWKTITTKVIATWFVIQNDATKEIRNPLNFFLASWKNVQNLDESYSNITQNIIIRLTLNIENEAKHWTETIWEYLFPSKLDEPDINTLFKICNLIMPDIDIEFDKYDRSTIENMIYIEAKNQILELTNSLFRIKEKYDNLSKLKVQDKLSKLSKTFHTY